MMPGTPFTHLGSVDGRDDRESQSCELQLERPFPNLGCRSRGNSVDNLRRLLERFFVDGDATVQQETETRSAQATARQSGQAQTDLSSGLPSCARKSAYRSKNSTCEAGAAASAGALPSSVHAEEKTAAARELLLSLRYSVPSAADAERNATWEEDEVRCHALQAYA